jgi:hypothetical protein
MGNVQLARPQLALGIGGGMSFYNTFLSDVIVIDTNKNISFSNYDIPGIKKYKINTNTFDLPLELRYRQNPNKHDKPLKISGGIKLSYIFSQHTKTKYMKSQPDRIAKNYNVPHLNQFNYGPTFKIAKGTFGLYAYYNLLTVFNTDKAPAINQAFVAVCVNVDGKDKKFSLPKFPFKTKPQQSATSEELIFKSASLKK